MEAVNLLPAYARPGHPWAAVGRDLSARRVLKAGSVVACVAVLGLGLGYVYERSAVNDRRATLADVQAEVAVADAKAAPLRSAQAAAAARMAAAATVSEKRVAWEQLLADLSRVLPSQVYLQSLSLQSPTPLATGASTPAPTTPATGTPTPATTSSSGFSATGVASSHVSVALVLDRLASLPWLSNVTLLSTANGGASGTTLSRGDTFSVTAVFNPNGGAE
jgi:Tfp pilus assembly protein PilN